MSEINTPSTIPTWLLSCARATLVLCLCVVVLGAYVRLSDAGLGCPDWPGCYGQLLVPSDAAGAGQAYPQRPLETAKAWKEMAHRYAASLLGLLIVTIAVGAWRHGLPRALLLGSVALVIFQGLLGMWTVTWQLKPLVVTAHLLGGMSTLAVLAVINLQLNRAGGLPARRWPAGLRRLATLGLLILAGQIFLGGWTSSNYAALACTDFPTCHQQWWPQADFAEAFVLWRGLGVNYEFGVLDSPARTAIHLSHRLGALLTTLVLLLLAWRLWREREPGYSALLAIALLGQVAIGIGSVLLALPLPLAAAHNAGAALLVLVLTAINERAWRRARLAT